MKLLALSTVMLLAAAPANAQLRLPPEEGARPAQSPRPSLSFRVSDDFAPDGTRRQRRGILAGVDVAPQTTIGIGFFDTAPKVRGPGFESRIDSFSKRSRKAAVGMSFRF